MHIEINRQDIQKTRLVATSAPTELQQGQVVLHLERAALTSNNVSYALSGDMLDYWGFFPTDSDWGRLPVMGFGIVTASNNPGVAVGGRYFGFFPLGDHHVVSASPSRSGFTDAAAWRDKHAAVYRNFDLADPTPHDDATLIFRIFSTSYLIEDFLRERGNFGARQVIITSASSKTSIALAHCLQRSSDVNVVGLTSSRNLAFTTGTNEYDEVVDYKNLASLRNVPSVVVDMAGNPNIVAEVHRLLAGSVEYSCSVGATHWDAERSDTTVPPPRPEFFFAPSQIAQRAKEWGRDELNRRISDALAVFVDSSALWMTVRHTQGADAVISLYADLVAGRCEANIGNIVSFG
jgi:hypothetical protein